MRSILATSVVLALCTSVVRADLRYTTRAEVRRTAAAGPEPVPEVSTALHALMPPGETRIFVRADAMRVEQSVGATSTIALTRPDGQFVLYPASRTYARVPPPAGNALPIQTAAPVIRRTGELSTIHGLRAERVLVTMTLAPPIAPQAGFPSAITLEGELWVSEAYASEGLALRKLLGPVGNPLNGVEGMILKQVLRVPQLGFEVETQVTDLVEGPIDAALFQIPVDYRPIEQLVIPNARFGGRR